MITRRQVIGKAREYLNTPFHHQGRLKGVGIDCIGLIVGVAAELNMPYGDLSGYPRHPDGRTIIREFDKYMAQIPSDDLQPGDVAVFWMRRDKLPMHAGIVSDLHGGLGLIHTWATTKFVVEHQIDDRWRRHMHCGYLYPGVEATWQQ